MHLSSAPTAVVEVGAGGRAARHQYRPAGLDYELDARAGPLDKRLRALAKRGQRELQIEELDRVLQSQKSTVMQIRRRILHAAKPEGLDRAVSGGKDAVDHHR